MKVKHHECCTVGVCVMKMKNLECCAVRVCVTKIKQLDCCAVRVICVMKMKDLSVVLYVSFVF